MEAKGVVHTVGAVIGGVAVGFLVLVIILGAVLYVVDLCKSRRGQTAHPKIDRQENQPEDEGTP